MFCCVVSGGLGPVIGMLVCECVFDIYGRVVSRYADVTHWHWHFKFLTRAVALGLDPDCDAGAGPDPDPDPHTDTDTDTDTRDPRGQAPNAKSNPISRKLSTIGTGKGVA